MAKRRPFGDPLFGPFNGAFDDLFKNYRIVKTTVSEYRVFGKARQRKIRTIKKSGFLTEEAANAYKVSLGWTGPEYTIEEYAP